MISVHEVDVHASTSILGVSYFIPQTTITNKK